MANKDIHEKIRDNSTAEETGLVMFCMEQSNYYTFFRTLETTQKEFLPTIEEGLYYVLTRCDENDITIKLWLTRTEFERLVDTLEAKHGLYLKAFGWNQFDVFKG